MAETPIISDVLASNPALDVSGSRFSVADGANINRTVAYLHRFLPFYRRDGQSVEVRGHSPASAGPVAAFYNELSPGTPDTTAAIPYLMDVGGASSPTQTLFFKHIMAAIQLRDASRVLLSGQVDYVKTQKRALAHALWKYWNQQAILGDSSVPPGQFFDGLQALITRGLGQVVTPAASDQLDQLDEAMEAIRVHDRQVNLIVMNYTGVRKLQQLLRNKGLHPRMRHDPRMNAKILHYNGIPVCQSDFIPVATTVETAVYFLSVGEQGVYAARPSEGKRIFFKSVRMDKAPFVSLQVHMFSAIVSTTSDALAQIPNWDVSF